MSGLRVHLFVDGDELPAPIFGEVFEFGVLGADKVEFHFAAPAFELFLAGDGLADGFVSFVVKQAGAAIALGKPLKRPIVVLANSDVHIAGDADVERASGASHDVGIAGFHVGTILRSG